MAEETQLALPEQEQQPKQQVSIVRATERGVQFSTLGEIGKFAVVAVNSGIYKDLPSPEVAIIKIQAGLELGLSPVWSLTNIMVVNGRPSVWGDALLGIVRGSPLCEDIVETYEGEGDKTEAICVAKRKGCAPVTGRFSVEDARRANLWDKAGPWKQFPRRMLMMRARTFACRDAFADLLRGITSVEESETFLPRAKGRAVESDNSLRFPDEQ